jgi:uncharacterized membrane protein YqaE (UPF0057 family)
MSPSTSPFQQPSQHHPSGKILSTANCPTCHAEQKRTRATDGILACLTVLCPPAVAYIKSGRKQDVWLNLGLTVFGWGPGMLRELNPFSLFLVVVVRRDVLTYWVLRCVVSDFAAFGRAPSARNRP